MEITKGKHWSEATIEGPFGGVKFAFVGRPDSERFTARYTRKTRLYPGSIENRLAELKAQREALPSPKGRGEDPANDKAYDEYNKAYLKAARAEAKAVLEALVAAGILAEVPSISFSRKAGCSCPCSPGFIVNGAAVELDGKPVDLSLA